VLYNTTQLSIRIDTAVRHMLSQYAAIPAVSMWSRWNAA